MRNLVLLLQKDLRLLVRSPSLLLVLVAYPILVSLIVTSALQGEGRKPPVAFVNLDSSGRTVRVGDDRLSVDDYVELLAERVRLRTLGPEEAEDALEAGRVAAVLTLPEGFIADLQSGVRQPTLLLTTSGRSPIQAVGIQRSLEAEIYRLNQRLAQGYVGTVVQLVDLVINGGEISVLGRTGQALGLVRSRELVEDIRESLVAAGSIGTASRLAPLINFIDATRANLDLARPAANAISSPIELRVARDSDESEPLSAFGFAGALLVSLGLAGVLLAAAGLSAEREDNALARLRRGLVAPGGLVAEKLVYTALSCLVIGLVLLGGVTLLTSLAIGRWGLWLAALAISGLAFGALGVLLGALARETRTALLAGLMLALPLLSLSLLPAQGLPNVISQAVPFGPAFDTYQILLLDPALSGEIVLELGHLAGLTVIFGTLAAVAVARRPT